MLKKIFAYPAANLVKVIPTVLVISFIVGNFVDTGYLKVFILPLTLVMIYPTMIGFKIWEAFNFTYGKVVVVSFLINFIFIPLVAYTLGKVFLTDHPQIFAGLAIAALLPTSGMTISWTMINKGNVVAAIKITVLSLLTGAILAPWYLFFMVGQYIPINIFNTFKTIAIVVLVPLVLGTLTYKFILMHLTEEEFKKKVKPQLPRISVWALMFVIFISTSNKAAMILANPQLIWLSITVLLLFYIANYFISTFIGKIYLDEFNGYALIYGTAMRNLSLALGIAATSFGSEAMLIITLAYILQVQSAAWYGKFVKRYGLLTNRTELSHMN